ncbi:hypothetical protein ACFQVD_23990 [Streptosporangium amethystogenes subsp. fukuiense]|uniref:Uncharacterized protein n=1 Tax=Streptosporangium amethystogenes subsp. fukuiense TaxID=698418 RepID=A0ABW2T3I5_9ACTN
MGVVVINVEAGRLREPAAWLMLAVASASVLVGIERLLFGGSSFAVRATGYLGQLTSPTTAALLVGAVLLATHLGPVIERLKPMALVAAGTLALSVLFGAISLLTALFGGVTDLQEKIEILLIHLPALALITVALLYVLPKAIPAGSRAGALRAEDGFGRPAEHPREQGYHPQQPVPAQGPVPFQDHPQGQVPFQDHPQGPGGYPQGQMVQQGVHHPQDQAPPGGHGYSQEAPPAQAPQPPQNLPALPPAPAHVSEGYGQQAASYAPSAPQAGDGQPQPPYQPPAESQPYAPPPGSYAQSPQQPEPQGQGYPQSMPQPPQPVSQPVAQTGGYTPSPYIAADVQPPAPAKPYEPSAAAYDPPVYAAPVDQQPQTEPRLPSYSQFPDSAYGQPEPQGFGRQADPPAYGQESQPVSSGRHSSPSLPSYPQFPDSPAYGQPEPQGFGRQADSSAYGLRPEQRQPDYGQADLPGYGQPEPQGFGRQADSPAYGQESQPAGSGRRSESQAQGYPQAEPHSEPPAYQRPEPQGFGQQDSQPSGYGHQSEQQVPAPYPPVDGRQGPAFDGQAQPFPQPPENYGQPFGGYPSAEFARPAEPGPQYPAPDPVDLRSQQMAQAYQQAESYQQQAQGTEPQLRVPEYGSSGYDGPFGHPQQAPQVPQNPPAPQAPYQPQGGGHQWDPRSEATLRFDPSTYTGDPLSDPALAVRTWDSQPIDPTAIYKPEQRPGQGMD